MTYNILIISPYVPYDTVGHAGGKTHNFYLKKFNEDQNFNVKLLTFAKCRELKKIDLDKYEIENDIVLLDNSFINILIRALYKAFSMINVFDKYGGILSGFIKMKIIHKLKEYKKNGYNPDIIILEWTQIVFLGEKAKQIFPNAKIIASEHDVTFLNFRRDYEIEKSKIKKLKKLIKYKNMYKMEMNSLKLCDLVLPHNFKDADLLINNKISKSKLDYITPFYSDLFDIENKYNTKNILFFGDMKRRENYECCIWFIENVFNKLLKLDNEFKFYVVGGNPPSILKQHESENVIVTGFVDDIKEYFKNSLCMVSPLLLGAGIKVKVLEGMSAGLTVLTNDIGIEGIQAKDKEHFLYCKTAQDYINNLVAIRDDKIDCEEIGKNARNMLLQEFNLEKSYKNYKKNIFKLMEK